MANLKHLKSQLKKLADKKQAAVMAGFFKTGPGEYGEGDIFLGVKVPAQRRAAREYENLSLADLEALLNSKIHEYRLTALLILLSQYKKASGRNQKKIVNFYLKNIRNINNWDLVDLSAPNILGDYLLNKNRQILYKLAASKNLWEKRISVISTLAFIKNNEFNHTLQIVGILINSKHDLIHKAAGWMLREIGKRDREILENFLRRHYKIMPRVMLRYAIEKLNINEKKKFLKK